MGLGLQVVWQPEWPCQGCQDDAPFVASWQDLFAEPQLRLADTFPGWTLNWDSEGSGGGCSVLLQRLCSKAGSRAPGLNMCHALRSAEKGF